MVSPELLHRARAGAGLDVLVAVAHERRVTVVAVADLVVAVADYRHGRRVIRGA